MYIVDDAVCLCKSQFLEILVGDIWNEMITSIQPKQTNKHLTIGLYSCMPPPSSRSNWCDSIALFQLHTSTQKQLHRIPDVNVLVPKLIHPTAIQSHIHGFALTVCGP